LGFLCLGRLAVEHAVEDILLESPLSSDLDAGHLALLGKPIKRPLLDVIAGLFAKKFFYAVFSAWIEFALAGIVALL
jgi:hypothetical protein